MAKGPFHFKTFSVGQDGAAMKVGTDGIVLGCWSPVQGARRVMDIGAGNGYVGIMLLQRMEPGGSLIGVELEPEAAAQCQDNYRTQPFPAQATAWHGAIQNATRQHPEWKGTFDLIVSNPPFFKSKPKSLNAARNLARHDDTLPMGDLVRASSSLLKTGGRLCTIWPVDRLEEWNEWAPGYGFVIKQTVHIKTMQHLPAKRAISEWVKNDRDETTHIGSLTLEGKATLDFTEDYLKLVRPYLKGT